MSDEGSNKHTHRSWFDKLSHLLHREPQDREELLSLLTDAAERKLIDPQAFEMIEGVMEVSEMQVRDIMVPRSQMVVVDYDAKPAEFIPDIKQSGHSRFPVIGENKDQVIGILMAKDLIDYSFSGNDKNKFNLLNLLRPVNFVPESKRLDVLLREFRQNRNHMAIVIDEYGGVAGLVTIEDVLEEIVGDITDEHDLTAGDAYIKPHGKNRYLIQALTPIEDFNEHFDCDLSDEAFDTIGGLVTHNFGYLPQNGEEVTIDQFKFTVISADKRRLTLLEMTI